MPVVQQIVPTREREFWDSLDPNNIRQVLEAVKGEVKGEKISGSLYKVLIPS
jgi:hypothetical protein